MPGRSIIRIRLLIIASAVVLIAAILIGIVACQSEADTAVDTPSPVQLESLPAVIPLEGPFVVAVQPGHWKIDELPASSRRRPRSIGAVHGSVRELDINLAVVEALVPMLEAEGWRVIVVPATVPPGLRVDAFISIHADWGGDPERRGWKLAPPWRPSVASNRLTESLRAAFGEEEGLKEDLGGITVGMRGYFGFASQRYTYASSRYTPAVLVELGFVTNAVERELMVNRPDYYAGIIHRGLERHFYRYGRSPVTDLIPRDFPALYVGTAGAVVRSLPQSAGPVIRRLEAGDRLRPVDESGEWFGFRFRNPSQIGWVHRTDLEPDESLSMGGDGEAPPQPADS